MNCPQCDTENPKGARFCLKCGAGLALAYPECHTGLPPEARFCFACGARIELPSATLSEVPEDPAQRLQRLVPKEFAERLLATRGHTSPHLGSPPSPSQPAASHKQPLDQPWSFSQRRHDAPCPMHPHQEPLRI